MLSSAPVADSIRDELDRLTRAYDLKDAVVANLSDQARALQKVPAAHGTKVDLVEKSAGDPKFNCYRFAFGLDQLTDAVASLVFDYGGKGIGKNFVRFILDDLTEVTAAGANDGDVVVYAKDEEITHAGILQDDRVLSKWGEGHLWLHPTFLVPSSYGAAVRAFRPMPAGWAVDALIKYFRRKSGSEVVDAILGAPAG